MKKKLLFTFHRVGQSKWEENGQKLTSIVFKNLVIYKIYLKIRNIVVNEMRHRKESKAIFQKRS